MTHKTLFSRRQLLQAGAVLPVTHLTLASAQTQPAPQWQPTRPVTLIVANSAGGPVDVAVRLLARALESHWGQAVVIENKVGASGLMAARALTRAPSDGHTLGVIFGAFYTTLPFASEHMDLNPVSDLDPVTLLARTPFVYIVPKDSPIKSWSDYVALAKERDTTVGSYSVGTAFHLSWEMTARAAGIRAVYAPSASAGKTHTDLVGGLLDIALDAPGSAKAMIDSGRVRPIAVTSAQRAGIFPDVPTLAEQGLSGFSSDPWFAMSSPKGVSALTRVRIQRDVHTVLFSPELRKRLENMGMVPVGSTPEQLQQTITQDQLMIGPLVNQLGIKL